MQTAKPVISEAAKLTISTAPAAGAPLVAHRETLLGKLPSRKGHDYVLICDDAEKIIGMVSSEEIDRRLLASNQFERSRWTAMPIGALSKVSLSDSKTQNLSLTSNEIECSAIREGDNLFGISIGGDMFLSWKRLESLFTAALSDPLTGLMNRLAYERRLREEWSRSERTGTSIGIVVMDLDNFKRINDTYGHVVGDDLLTQVGRRLEEAMRSYDVVARFGGDEFVALCLGCSPGDVRIPMTRLIDGLNRISMKVDGEAITARASVGAAVRHADFETTEPEDLFIAADNCLYEAKKTRNSAWMMEFGCEFELELRQVGAQQQLVSELVRAAPEIDHHNNPL